MPIHEMHARRRIDVATGEGSGALFLPTDDLNTFARLPKLAKDQITPPLINRATHARPRARLHRQAHGRLSAMHRRVARWD